MLKDTNYQEKFVILNDWIPVIIDEVKKDLRQDHLKRDIGFARQFFPSKNPSKLTLDELVSGYDKALAKPEIAEELGEFISNRWLLKNTDLYYFFEENLKKVTNDFQDLKELERPFADKLAEEASRLFGPGKVYLFSVLNSVVFPKEVLETLRKEAEKERAKKIAKESEDIENKSWQDKEKNYQLQIARLEDRYEKKILGLQKKYQIDIETLKKQIATLQRKVLESKGEHEAAAVSDKPAKR